MGRDFPQRTSRYIAYFDVMVFKDFVYRSDHDDVEKLMEPIANIVDSIKNLETETLNIDTEEIQHDIEVGVCMPVLFSDSVLFVARGGSEHDLKKILFVSSVFLMRMFVLGIPVKGAVGYGEFTADLSKSMFFGRPLVDAYLLAEEAHFYGAILHHDVEARLLPEHFSDFRHVIKRAKVPMKSGLITHVFVDWRRNLRSPVRDVLDNLYKKASGSVRKYVDNTCDLSDRVQYEPSNKLELKGS